MTDPGLRAQHLSLAYDDTLIVDNLTVAIPNGRITGIVGANACGKSTLLRALVRLLRPSGGSVLLDGERIHRLPTKQVARHLGLLPQSPTAPEGLRVEDLVARGRFPHQRLFQQWSPDDEAAVAEVLSYADPEPIEGAPDWLLGHVRWRGWQLPLVAFARLTGIADEQPGLGNKMIVLKAFGGRGKLPFFAVLTQGFPRLVTVSRDGLIVDNSDQALPEGIQARVVLNQDDAFVPDLEAIEALVANAVAQAA
ncbi:MAG: ATP-binding cassette domain-containing protein [Proteobacteria bacterium]|nr:ATP-binding cassette domain-containing protein [Pseudomonadota bacterium]